MNLPYDGTEAEYAFWGPTGANVIETANGPYKISYTIEDDPAQTLNQPAPSRLGDHGLGGADGRRRRRRRHALSRNRHERRRQESGLCGAVHAVTASRGGARAARGFTLLEAMVSLLLLVIVLIVAMTMLFQMRAFAERQQYFMLPRQAARRAADYLSYYFAGASDVNYVDSHAPEPERADHVLQPRAASSRRPRTTTSRAPSRGTLPHHAGDPASGRRITSTKFGDIGTDIITMVAPFDPGRYQVFAPFPALGLATVDLWFNFRVGCATSDAANLSGLPGGHGFRRNAERASHARRQERGLVLRADSDRGLSLNGGFEARTAPT